LRIEFFYVPIIWFSDFVSSYYDIPKSILRLWLLLRSTYYHILKYLGYILRFAISVASAYAVWVLMPFSNQFAQITTPAAFLSVLLATEALKHLQQVAKSRIARYFKNVREHAVKKIEELKHKKRFFDYFVS